MKKPKKQSEMFKNNFISRGKTCVDKMIYGNHCSNILFLAKAYF